jgi:acylphosphatase
VAKRLEVLVTGRVQGVFFRASTREEARRLGLVGWVRNLPGGGVAALFEGEDAVLDAMERWCRRGPPGARVDRVEATRAQATGEFADFTVRP